MAAIHGHQEMPGDGSTLASICADGGGAAGVGRGVGAGASVTGVKASGVGAETVADLVVPGDAARAAFRSAGPASVLASEGGRTGGVCGRAGVGTAVWSAGRVTVPRRLKFCSSLGPTVTGVAELDVGGAGAAEGAAWASATDGATATAAATKILVLRKTALIRSRSYMIAASVPRGEQAIARRVPFIQALGR